MDGGFIKPGASETEEIEICSEVLRHVTRKGPTLTRKQLNYCDVACILRFLKAKSNDPRRAAKQLRSTLCWRKQLDVDNLTADEFPAELAKGHAYVAGNDKEERPILIVRLQPEHVLSRKAQSRFNRFFVFTMEVAISNMSKSAQQCVLILDMGFVKKAGSMGLHLFKILADHYPEIVAKTFVVDAPPIFYYLWKALGGFLGSKMRARVELMYSKHYLYHDKSSLAGQCSQWTTLDSMHSHPWISDTNMLARDPMPSYQTFMLSSPSSSTISSFQSSTLSSTPALVRDHSKSRSLSFSTNRENRGAPVEFRSFRATTTKRTDSLMDDGCSSSRWTDLPFATESIEESLESGAGSVPFHRNSNKKRIDPFLLYYMSFYLCPYNEAEYRCKMKAPLGGLISIVSSDLKSIRQSSFSFLNSRSMVMEEDDMLQNHGLK